MLKASTTHAARCVLTTSRPRIALALQHWQCHRHFAPICPRLAGQRQHQTVQVHAARSQTTQLPPDTLAEVKDLPDYDSTDEGVTDIAAVPTPAPPEQGK